MRLKVASGLKTRDKFAGLFRTYENVIWRYVNIGFPGHNIHFIDLCKKIWNIMNKVSNGPENRLDSDQARYYVGPGLGPN